MSFFLGFSDELLVKKVVGEIYRLPNPQSYFNEKTDIFYNNIILKCWAKCPILRPSLNDLHETLFSYFDVLEPGYNFPETSNKNCRDLDSIEEISEENPDQVNLGVLMHSGNYSEIWKSKN